MNSTPQESNHPNANINHLHWFLKGARGVASLPAIILMSSFIGFAAFAREAGFSLGETMFMVGTIWALPSHLVLVGGVIAGASTLTIVIGVMLASVRLMPMVMAQVPILRGEKTSRSTLLFLSHFIAITSWVFMQARYDKIPRDARAVYFAGFAIPVMMLCTILVGFTHALAGQFPPILAAALFFLTPVYFLTSLWGSANFLSDKWAMILGLALGPIFHLFWPEVDILLAGAVGGCVAFLLGILVEARKQKLP